MTSEGAFTGDLVLLATGVAPNCEIARRAGLACEQDRVLADAQMRTDHPRVFAAGDVALATNAAAGRRLVVEHWGEALRMGEIAGSVAAGGDDCWSQAPGFWSEIGDRTIKYAAWGDGFDTVHADDHGDAFTAWYGSDGVIVGVLAHERDADYEEGRRLVEKAAPWTDLAPR